MSELKAFNCVDSDLQEFCEPRLVYPKSDVDAAIAEKDAEIARLKAIRKVHVDAIESMGAGLLQDEEELRHQKYKRCLAMADGCRDKIKYWHIRYTTASGYDRSYEKWKHRLLTKWHKRWFKIAEKFKE